MHTPPETDGEAHKVSLWKGKIKLERQQNAPGTYMRNICWQRDSA